MQARLGVRFAFLLVSAVVVGGGIRVLAACDDAVLGERSLNITPSSSSQCDGAETCVGDELQPVTPDAACAEAVPPPPPPPSCDAGDPVVISKNETTGCPTSYACVLRCETYGGQCGTRQQCPGGRWSTQPTFDCNATRSDQGCCRACPSIAAPPAGFCDGSAPINVYEGDCHVSFACP